MKQYIYKGVHRTAACDTLLFPGGVYDLNPDDLQVKTLVAKGLLSEVNQPQGKHNQPTQTKTNNNNNKK